MESFSTSITVANYVRLLEKSYHQIDFGNDIKVQRIFRATFIILILICFLLARNFPPYREVLGAVMLLIGLFLLTGSIRSRIKKGQVKKIKQPFDQMLYQITEICEFNFTYTLDALCITLYKKDNTKRLLDFTFNQLTAYQWLGGGFLISNQDGIDFIIPEGIFESEKFDALHKGCSEMFKNKK
jgi:hypothetical protein